MFRFSVRSGELQVAAIREIIRSELSKVTGIDASTIEERANLYDLGLNSLSVLELALNVEKRFGIMLKDEDFYLASNIGAFADLIATKLDQIQ
jgi:acyl carrier protein